MDLFGRFRKLDSSLQRGLDNGFARVFGGEVVPAEIDELLKQEVEDAVMEDSSGALHAPSTFEVHVAARDYSTLLTKRPELDRELRDRLNRFIRNEGWSTLSPVTVDIIKDDGMHTGQLKCRSSFTAARDRQPGSEENNAARSGAAEWPRPEPDSGRSSAARPYDADQFDGAAGAADPGAASGAGAAGAGSLAGLARPQRRPTGWGDPDAGRASSGAAPASPSSDVPAPSEPSPEPLPEPYPAPRPDSFPPATEVVTGPSTEAVNGLDGLATTGSGGYQSAPQRSVTLHLQDGSNRIYVLKPGSNTIGRGNQVDFRLPDTGVSRRHGDITWDGFDAVLTDLRSTNGTTVNEIPVENWLLADGDVISMGHSEIEVRFS